MGSNSISNNSNNIRVNSNYTNKKYGSTIGKSGGSSQAALASRARTANTEEFDLSSPTVITEKENILKKSEITERIENWIMYLDNTGKSLKEEKDALTEKSRRFADSANRGRYPELFYEEKNQGSRKKYLSPSEAIKSDKCFKKYLKENGYPTDRERMSTDKYNLLKKQYADYINTTYTEKYSECFNEFVGMTYADYRERLTQINSDIENIKASRYELVQQAKEQPYIELMDTDDFQNYITNNKNNPNSELYKLYGIKNETVEINDDSYWRFEYFTEQDMLIFSYLWDTQSPKVAREYVEAIEDKLNKAEGLANAEKFLDSIRDENGNIDPDVWAGVLSSAKGFENGVSTFFEGLGNVFNGEGMMSTSQYEQMYILSELTNSSGNYIGKLANKIMENQGEEAVTDFISKIYNKETNTIDLEYAKTVLSEQEYNNLVIKINTDKKSILDNVYELSSSAGNMLPSMIVSMAVSAVATPAAGSVVGSTLMGISSGGNSKNQALVQGNDLFTSTMYGVFSGVSETTLGLLLGNIPGLNEGATFSFRGLVKEGFEEMLQEYVDAGLRASLLDETIDLDQLGDDAFKSFIYGALMSGIMNGGKLVFTIKNGIQSTKINSVQELVNFVKETGVDIDTSQIEGIMSDTQQSSVSSNSSIGESKVQTSSINPSNLDIDNQITMANYHTDKGLTTTIDIDSVSSLTESQINSIKNVDNVIFRLPDGSNMNISQLLNARLNLSGKTISGTANVSMDLDSQIARANMYTNKGNFASIDITDISMITNEVLSKIDNVDNVVFRLPDGSSLSYNELLTRRNNNNNKTHNINNVGSAISPEARTIAFQNTIEENILEVIHRHDMMYEPGDALRRLMLFFNPESENFENYNLITHYNDARNILSMYSPQQIRHALENLNYIKNGINSSISGFFSHFGNSKEGTYGADQAGISSLCKYIYNGKEYTYEQAMDVYNGALKQGKPLPHFKKQASAEYFKLKNKLLAQGFSSSDASIIMSTIDDAGACTYAATVNEIFYAFKGREYEFQQKFGYPMYKIENGKTKLNFNELLLDLYVYVNSEENGGSFILNDKSLNPDRLRSDRHDVFGRVMLDAEKQVYLSNFSYGKNEPVIADFLISKNINYYGSKTVALNNGKTMDINSFKEILNNVFNELYAGKSLSLDIFNWNNIIHMISINENLYPSVSTDTWSEGSGHAVFITGIGDGGFYVSSWGSEYNIPFKDLMNGGVFRIHSSIIN